MARIEITRGDIVLVDLSGAIGSEHQNHSVSNTRPCVVVQNDGGNKASPVTIVAPITDDGSYRDIHSRLRPQQHKSTESKSQLSIAANSELLIGTVESREMLER